MTAFALVALAFLGPVAAVFLGWVLTRWRRHQRVGEWLGLGAGLAGAFLLVSALAIAGWALPDALDRLPAEERDALGPALAAAPECRVLPFARVLAVEIDRTPEGLVVLRYRCGLTHFGYPSSANEARCVESEWHGPGLMQQWSAGTC